MNLYEILGLTSSASSDQIHQAYRRMARELHPDRNPGPEAHRRMSQVNEAYRVLGDETRRRAYDRSQSGLGPSLHGSFMEAARQVLLRRGWTVCAEGTSSVLFERLPHRALVVFQRSDWRSLFSEARERRATSVIGLWPEAELPSRSPASLQILLIDLVSSRCRWTVPPDPELWHLVEPLAGRGGSN